MAKAGPIIPKNVQKLATRTLILLFLVAGGVFGIQWWLAKKGDIDLSAADTKDMILALHSVGDGQQAVVVKGDGSIVGAPGFSAGNTDRDATWNPSGNRAFFVSDRSGKAFHVYRWNPSGDGEPQQRTVDNSGRSAPYFAVENVPEPDKSALITARGNVEEFFPTETRTERVLPPNQRDIKSGEEGGAAGAFEAAYQRFGTSFRLGRWCHGKQYVAAIMRREQGGEVLILQSLVASEKGLPPPQPIVAGEHIEIDVAPNGDLAFTSQGYDFATPDEAAAATKNNKVVRPFRHLLGLVTFPNDAPKPESIAAAIDDKQAFGRLAFAPDASRLAVVVGSYQDGIRPLGMVSFPARANGGAQASPLVRGEVDQPSFSRKGDQIVYVRRNGNERGIYVASADGSGERAMTTGKGDFSEPKFSPQH